jgi:SAM-dependent methyltransferase
VLKRVLPARGMVLEIASGTGQHVVHFAGAMPHLMWQPSDPDPELRASIRAWIAQTGLSNVRAPLELDVCRQPWPVDAADAVLCINMIHISPWTSTNALCIGAARHLRTGGKLVLYGPYLEGGTAVKSNLDFDATLKRRNLEWGLRDLEEVTRTAALHGLQRQQIVRMPANNLTVVFSKTL